MNAAETCPIHRRAELAAAVAEPSGVVGASGHRVYGGTFHGPSRDFNPDIAEEKGYGSPSGTAGIYDKMVRTLPSVGLLVRVTTMPIRSLTWSIDYPRDTPRAWRSNDVLERCRAAYFAELENWDNYLATAAECIVHGFEPFEVEDQITEDGAYSWRRFLWRAPFSIQEIHLADERLSWVRQWAQKRDDGGLEYLDIGADRLLWHTHGQRGDHVTGLSILRSCFGPWRAILDIWRYAGMRFDRSAVPTLVAALSDAEFNDDAIKDHYEEIGRGLRASPHAYAVMHKDSRLELLGGNPGADDLVQMARYYAWEILSAGAAQFLALGTTDTGSRAVGSVQARVYWRSLKALVAEIAGPVNDISRAAPRGTIKRLVDMNFGPQRAYPELYAAVPRAETLQELAGALTLLTQGGFLHARASDQAMLRDEIDFPGLTPEDADEIEGNLKRKMEADEQVRGPRVRPEEPTREPQE
jgi:hypothetical protein